MSISEKQSWCNKLHEKHFPVDASGKGPGCCACIPLKVGVSAICVYAFIDAINQAQLVIRAFMSNVMVGLCCIPVLFFMAINCFFFVKYCQEDSLVTRKRLVIGCSLSLFANVLSVILLAGSCFFDPGMVTMLPSVLIGHAITISLWIYSVLAVR